MKTTIEISDRIYRQVKARVALNGQTMRAFFLEALREKLQREREAQGEEPGWMQTFGKASSDSIAELQEIIDEEFSKIDEEGWQ